MGSGQIGVAFAVTSDRIPNTNLAPNPAPCLLQVPYDAGFILVRNGALLRETFYSPAAYLAREGGGPDGRVVVAHGLRPRPVPGVQGHEDVVHSQGEAWWRGEAIRVMMETCAAGARHGGTERGHGQEL